MAASNASDRGLSRLGRAWDRLIAGIQEVMAILVAVAVLAVVYEVVLRYFFNSPTIWAADLTEYVLVYITFFGAACLLRDRAHIRVDMLVTRLGPRPQLFLDVILALVAAVVMAVFVWKGTELVWEALVNNQVMLKAWRVPRWAILLPVPMGSLLMCVEFLRQAGEAFQAWVSGRPAHVPLGLEAGERGEQRGL
jgi:C4-dicarboxylate transporter DctQ subunit